MTEVVGIKFNKTGKVYFFDPKGNKLNIGDGAVVETARGTEFGYVAVANRQASDDEIIAPLKPIIRKATNQDFYML